MKTSDSMFYVYNCIVGANFYKSCPFLILVTHLGGDIHCFNSLYLVVASIFIERPTLCFFSLDIK